MKYIFLAAAFLLYMNTQTLGQTQPPAQKTQPGAPKTQPGGSQPTQQPLPQKLTPEQEAQMIAQMQARAKTLTIPQLKSELEQSPNPPLYVKQILKKRFKIDTIVVTRTRNFNSMADSLAYTGKERKVYGPYGEKDGRFLVQLLTKAPNAFYHISQIFIDTAVFRYRIADSIGNLIIDRLKKGTSTFEELARTYSMGGEGGGDLGWIARGTMVPQIEHEVNAHKKGEVFKIWSANGLHIIQKTDNPKNDTGFALMMRIFL